MEVGSEVSGNSQAGSSRLLFLASLRSRFFLCGRTLFGSLLCCGFFGRLLLCRFLLCRFLGCRFLANGLFRSCFFLGDFFLGRLFRHLFG